MENDMKQPGTPLSQSFTPRLASISKRLISLGEAKDWALKDIKFLVYDDTDAKVDGYDSSDEEGMMEFAMKMSMGLPSDDQERSEICSSCPEFPHNRKTRKFRLFKPADTFPDLLREPSMPKSVDVCVHYVAVSYCWPVLDQRDDSLAANKVTYQVRELDGTIRRTRALDDVLDRAVDVANSCGLRMIWIDQECIPQPKDDSPEDNKYEQQLGVQAMDIVYNRAIVTAGLHDVTITSPGQIHAIRSLIQMDETRQLPHINDQFLDHILQFFESVSLDRWYTRAWIAQEALSAGIGLMIVLRRSPGISYSSHFRLGKKYVVPKHTLDYMDRKLPSENICITLAQFRGMMRAAKSLLEQNFLLHGQALVQFNDQPITLLSRAAPILRAVESLYPAFARQLDSNKLKLQMIGGYNYGSRWTVDAAGALTILKTRECRDQQDLVAILANMCSYDIRLDTQAVAEAGSLREGIISLALLNGDLSLLVPEAYQHSESRFSSMDYDAGLSNLRLMSPLDVSPHMIDHVSVRNFNQHKTHILPSITEKGINFHSYVWKIEDELDLLPIKYQYDEAWEELKCLRITVDELEKETAEQFDARRQLIMNHFSMHSVMRQAKKDLFLKPYLTPESKAWDGIENAGVYVTQALVAQRVQEMPEMQRIISGIVFATLRYLLNLANTDPRARGLATSIWQSLRTDMVGDRDDLPDEVDDILFDHSDVVTKPFQTLRLDVTRDREYSQLWFVDRIMKNGTLWIGRYNRLSPQRLPYGPDRDRGQGPEIDFGLREDSGSSQSPKTLKGKEPMLAENRENAARQFGPESHKILRRQLRRDIIAQMIAADTNDINPGAPRVVPGTLSGFLEVVVGGLWRKESEERRMCNLVSTFDVDGPCTVLTPYNSDWEMLPHPELRSMSVCWVINPLKPDNQQPSPSSPSLPQTLTSNISNPLDFSAEASASEPCKPVVPESNPPRSNTDGCVYGVVSKVRGLWALMDPPIQAFTIA
ncbi:hypothetical protein HD806DRAFT_523966 [Xylariaceae sp. AK1471]|nr:hypothetical protein HD806DRAFT_523966 [Xylariaceae sp. AK1471]